MNQTRKRPNPWQILGWNDQPVVVRPDRCVVLANRVDDVLKMIDDGRRGDAASAEKRSVHHHPDRASAVGHPGKLLVGDVAPVRVHSIQSGVGHEQGQRLVVDFDGIEETRAADVGEALQYRSLERR